MRRKIVNPTEGAQLQNVKLSLSSCFSLNLVSENWKTKAGNRRAKTLRETRVLFVARLSKEPKTGSYIQFLFKLSMQ